MKLTPDCKISVLDQLPSKDSNLEAIKDKEIRNYNKQSNRFFKFKDFFVFQAELSTNLFYSLKKINM